MSANKLTIYGSRAVIEAIRAGSVIEKIMIEDGKKNDLIRELIAEAKNNEIPYQFIPSYGFKKFGNANHQGVIAMISPVQFADVFEIITSVQESGRDPLILILDKITDTRNFGAIVRSAECNGVHCVVIPAKGSASITEDAVKTSAGALMTVPVCRSANLKTTIDELKDYGIRIAGCTEKGSETIYREDLNGPLAIIMGNEGEGISPEYLKKCDVKIAIPMYGKIDSLNVSVASGIVMYEVNRQRNA